jgi:hypothetical protein
MDARVIYYSLKVDGGKMVDFPWDISFGLAIVLSGTAAIIVYILMLDNLEK